MMASKKPWIPPPCLTATSKWESKLKEDKQVDSVLEVVSKELNKLESLVSFMESVLNGKNTEPSTRVQDERRIEKEQKHSSDLLPSMCSGQREQRHLLESVLSEISNTNCNLAAISRILKEETKPKEKMDNKESYLHSKLELLEKQYIEDVKYLKNNLLSHRVQSRVQNSSLKVLMKKLFEKEEDVRNLTNQCDELKLSLTDVTNQKVKLEAENRNLKIDLEQKQNIEYAHLKEKYPDEQPETKQTDIQTSQVCKELRGTIHKLKKHEKSYKGKLEEQERKLKKCKKIISQLTLKLQKERSWKTKIPRDTDAEENKLKKDLNTQAQLVSSLKAQLEIKNKDLKNKHQENRKLKSKHSSEISQIKNELGNVLESKTSLQSQLQQLKIAYDIVFPNPTNHEKPIAIS